MKRLVILGIFLLLALHGAEAGEVEGTVELQSAVGDRAKNSNSARRKKSLKSYNGKALGKAQRGGEGGPSPNEEIDERNFAVLYLVRADGKKMKATSKVVEVRQEGRRFRDHVTPIALGSKVRFTNEDKFYHHIYCPDASNMNVPEHRGAIERKPAKTGKYELFCDIHPLMNGYVYVAPNDHFSLVKNGKYSLANVPPGKYVLKVWHPRLPEQSKSVNVSAEGKTKVNITL